MGYRILISAIAWLLAFNLVEADERDAIEALEKSGATVQRDDSQKTKPVTLVTWNLRQVTPDGNQALAEIEDLPAVDFRGSGVTDLTIATLRALQGKTSLKRFTITHAKISDDGAKILGTLKSLESLDLHTQIEISPQGFEEIFRLTNLKDLTLSDRLVSDVVLGDLSKLPNLKTLAIRSVFVSDDGIAALHRLRNLKTLRIFVTPSVTDEGLRKLGELRLSEVDITCFNVTDARLKELRKMDGLKALRLLGAKAVTDETVPYFAEMSELKELEIVGGQLSKAGIKELKAALPNCKFGQVAQ